MPMRMANHKICLHMSATEMEAAKDAIVPDGKPPPEPRYFSANLNSTTALRDVAMEHGMSSKQCEYG